MKNQFYLLKEKRFRPYFLTQLLGAFNDNLFKNALVILIVFQGAGLGALDTNVLVNLAALLFILPFFLFSATAGQLADKYEKSRLIRIIKLCEIGIMFLAVIAFYFNSTAGLLLLLFLMGTQSSFFGPVKYSILPQHLKTSELTGGNGLVESGTFVAILLGNIFGEKLMSQHNYGVSLVCIFIVVIAVCGYLTSRSIPTTPASDPNLKFNWNAFSETLRIFKHSTKNKSVFNSILGISWFWFLGACYLAQLPNYTSVYLRADASVYTLLLAGFSLGIGIGSLLCERFSGNKVEPGLVPLGAFGLTCFGIDLYFASLGLSNTLDISNTNSIDSVTFMAAWNNCRVLIDITFIGVFGGFYIVPLYAMIQQRSPIKQRARIIASNNILNALFMVSSALFSIVVLNSGFSIPELFLMIAISNIAVAAYIFTLVPEFTLRFFAWLLIKCLYRVKPEKLDNIPSEGPALLVCNHVSFVDPLIIMACSPRPIRFVMYYKIFNITVLRYLFTTAKAIPIAGKKENAELLNLAMLEIKTALQNDELVCIFPEGGITSTGELTPFKPGVESILRDTPVKVVPMALSGLWGTFFSRQGSAAMRRLPRSWMKKIRLVAGDLIAPAGLTAGALQNTVETLRGNDK